MRTPPIMGPATDAAALTLEIMAKNRARRCSGTQYPITAIPPATIAACPTPATALPAINMGELVAAAHRAEPTSKIKIENAKVHLKSK